MKGQWMFDLAVALVVVCVMVFLGLNLLSITMHRTQERITTLTEYNIVMIAGDDIIKHGKVVRSGSSVRTLHHVLPDDFNPAEYEEKYRDTYNIDISIKVCGLYDSCRPDVDGICITRLAVRDTGLGYEPVKVLVCGRKNTG